MGAKYLSATTRRAMRDYRRATGAAKPGTRRLAAIQAAPDFPAPRRIGFGLRGDDAAAFAAILAEHAADPLGAERAKRRSRPSGDVGRNELFGEGRLVARTGPGRRNDADHLTRAAVAFAERIFEAFDVREAFTIRQAARAGKCSIGSARKHVEELTWAKCWPYEICQAGRAELDLDDVV